MGGMFGAHLGYNPLPPLLPYFRSMKAKMIHSVNHMWAKIPHNEKNKGQYSMPSKKED